MSLGSNVRKLFGRHERLAADLWRSMFLDLDDWTGKLQEWCPAPRRVLEVGCGEGYSTEKLAAAFPQAEIVGIDIALQIGRLYRGPADRVSFRIKFAEELALEEPAAFDLIVMCDVLHHVPAEARSSLLAAVKALLAPGGTFAFKDWSPSATPIHWLCYGSDRWITGDRVAHLKRGQARELLAGIFGSQSLEEQQWIKPWRNNYSFLLQR